MPTTKHLGCRPEPAGRLRHLVHFALAVAVPILVVTACGAGQTAQTANQVAPANGAQGDAGPIALRNALLAHPGDRSTWEAGEDVPLSVTIANAGDVADELMAVRTDAADEVVVAGPTVVPGGTAISSAAESSSVHESAATAGAGPPARPPGRPVDPDALSIVLTDLTGPVRPGLPTVVTFLFRGAGEVTLRVPMSNPEGSRQ